MEKEADRARGLFRKIRDGTAWKPPMSVEEMKKSARYVRTYLADDGCHPAESSGTVLGAAGTIAAASAFVPAAGSQGQQQPAADQQ